MTELSGSMVPAQGIKWLQVGFWPLTAGQFQAAALVTKRPGVRERRTEQQPYLKKQQRTHFTCRIINIIEGEL